MAVNFPANPIVNQIYAAGERTWFWTGVYWKATSSSPGFTGSRGQSSYVSSDTAPTNPQIGDRWYNTTDAIELVWTSDSDSQQWVEIAASGFPGDIGYTGSQGEDGRYGGVGFTGSASTVPGYTGSEGEGYTGSQGYTGSRGPTGPIGFTGSSGAYAAIGYTGSIGTSGFVWQNTQYTNFNAVSGCAYPVNTVNGPVTVTFPANPELGSLIHLMDYAGTWATNAISVSPNGNRINGALAQATLNQVRESISFVYIDYAQGWLPFSGFNAPNLTQTLTSTYMLIGAGGGGGGTSNPAWAIGAGGGGAGGYTTGTISLTSGTNYNFVIGAGGAGGVYGGSTNGGNSSAFNITMLGGGYGGLQAYFAGGNGGSGGGGAADQNNVTAGGGSGTVGQGGNGYQGVTNGGYQFAAAWGGGGGGAGGNATSKNGANGVINSIAGITCICTGSISGTTLTVTSVTYGYLRQGAIITGTGISDGTVITSYADQGGAGSYTVNNSQNVGSTTITVSSLYYAAGAGGGSNNFAGNSPGSGGLGGAGGGGYYTNASNGCLISGAGGAGAGAGSNGGSTFSGGNGGSGVLILSIPNVYYTGQTTGSPTVNTFSSPGYTLLTYTQSGSYTA